MTLTGFDDNNRLISLPDSLDEYYSGAAKRFAHIMEIAYIPDSFEASGGVIRGDFALLRAFIADHDRQLTVRIGVDHFDKDEIVLFFPDFLYGFVEDTFARAIHHKIEGSGYACRECVGKYELRIREYDRLFGKVADDDITAAFNMGFGRLLHPVDLADANREEMESFLRDNCREVLLYLAEGAREKDAAAAYMTERDLLSSECIDEALPRLSDTAHAQIVALLLGYQNKRRRRKRLSL